MENLCLYYYNQFNIIKGKKLLAKKIPSIATWLSENDFDFDSQKDLILIFEKVKQSNP